MRRYILLLACGLLAVSAGAQRDDNQTISGFSVPEYTEDGTLKSRLYGDYAKLQAGGVIEITNLRIEFYDGETVSMEITAPRCTYNRERGLAMSQGKVRIERENMIVTGTGFSWSADRGLLRIFQDSAVELAGVQQHMEETE